MRWKSLVISALLLPPSLAFSHLCHWGDLGRVYPVNPSPLSQEEVATFPELLEHLPLYIRICINICPPAMLRASQEEGLGFIHPPWSPQPSSGLMVNSHILLNKWMFGGTRERAVRFQLLTGLHPGVLFLGQRVVCFTSIRFTDFASPAESKQWNSVPFSRESEQWKMQSINPECKQWHAERNSKWRETAYFHWNGGKSSGKDYLAPVLGVRVDKATKAQHAPCWIYLAFSKKRETCLMQIFLG